MKKIFSILVLAVIGLVLVACDVPSSTQFTVTFNSQGGSAVAAQTVDQGETADEPSDPTRSGFEFDGWFTAATGGTEFLFTTTITANITLYAHWTAVVVDTVPPTIAGATNITVNVGDDFDPLAGVTATDLVSGNVTASLQYTSNPTLDLDTEGEYTLTYTATDAAGNQGTATRVVTVIAPVLGNLLNGDFSSGLGGWATWVEDHATAEFNVVDGVLEINVIHLPGDSQWWNVQLQYNALNLNAFESYRLEFEVKADVERYMNHQIQGGGIPAPGKAYGEKNFTLITTTWQTIGIDFYVRGNATNAQLQFSFGNYDAVNSPEVPESYRVVETKVYLDNVKIVPGPVLENQAPTLTANNIVVKTGTPTTLLTGVTVQDDFSPLQISDVVYLQTEGPEPFNTANPAKGVYKFELEVEDEEGLRTTATRTITVADPWNRPESMALTGQMYDWSGTFTGFYFRHADGDWAEVTYDEENDVTKVDFTAEGKGGVPNADYKAAFLMSQVQFFAGTYVISFQAKADQATHIRIAVEGSSLAANVAFQDFAVGTEWVTVTVTYTFAANQLDKAFQVFLGSILTNRGNYAEGEFPFTEADIVQTAIYFRNFDVVYTAPTA